jgi:hypothetical protein
MASPDHACERLKKCFRAVEWIDVQFTLILAGLIVGIHHHRGDAELVGFRTKHLTLTLINGLPDDHGIDATALQDIQGSIKRSGGYYAVSGMGQDRVAEGGH